MTASVPWSGSWVDETSTGLLEKSVSFGRETLHRHFHRVSATSGIVEKGTGFKSHSMTDAYIVSLSTVSKNSQGRNSFRGAPSRYLSDSQQLLSKATRNEYFCRMSSKQRRQKLEALQIERRDGRHLKEKQAALLQTASATARPGGPTTALLFNRNGQPPTTVKGALHSVTRSHRPLAA